MSHRELLVTIKNLPHCSLWLLCRTTLKNKAKKIKKVLFKVNTTAQYLHIYPPASILNQFACTRRRKSLLKESFIQKYCLAEIKKCLFGVKERHSIAR